MVTKPVRLSELVVDEAREVSKEIGEPSDDTTFRFILDDRKRLKVENELLRMKLEECEKKKETGHK